MATEYKKILVTLDGSTFASQALPHAETLAALFGAELILFQAVPDASNVAEILDSNKNFMHVDDRQMNFIDEATQKLGELVSEFNLHDIKTTAVVEVGSPAETIIDYAQENEVDLIVMTTHGRSGLARWVYGSVADKVLRAAHCPVFLIRAVPG